MSETPTRSTEIKYLATEAGVARAPERDDLANEFLRAHRSRPHEHALDDFAEETPAAAATAAARSHAPAVPTPADGSREFAWPPENEEWTPVEHVPPVRPRRRGATHWVSEFVPIAAIVAVFLLIVTSVGVWMVRDVRTTRAARERAAAPLRDVPPLAPRPPSWAEAAAKADSEVLPSGPGMAATSAPPGPLTASPAAPPATAPAAIPAKPAAPRSNGAVVAAERAAQTSVPRPDAAAARTRVTPPAPPSVSSSPAPPPAQALGTPTPPATRPSPSPAPAFTPPPAATHLEEPLVVPAPAAANETPPVTASRSPAAAAATPAAPAATVVSTDEDDIRRVLGQYRSAYSQLDPYAARTVWPTVNLKALSRAFDQLSSQTLEFKQCRVSVSSASAIATCDGTASYVPRVGSRSERTEPRRLRFDLHKGSAGWTIDSVSTR